MSINLYIVIIIYLFSFSFLMEGLIFSTLAIAGYNYNNNNNNNKIEKKKIEKKKIEKKKIETKKTVLKKEKKVHFKNELDNFYDIQSFNNNKVVSDERFTNYTFSNVDDPSDVDDDDEMMR